MIHLDVVTLAWNGVAAAGVGFSVAVLPRYWRARDAARGSAELSAADRASALRLAHTYLWAESSRLCCHTISLALGVWALFVPRVPQADVPRSVDVFHAAVLAGIIAINCLTVANSIRAYVSWRRG